MRLKLKVEGDNRAELESEAFQSAQEFFGHDRFALVMWEVTPTNLTAGGEKLAELLGMPAKRFKATVTASERRTRPFMREPDEDEDETDSDD